MKLLLDANLSQRLVARLAELFPGMTHVFYTGLAKFTSDIQIWDYAQRNEFTIVTTDADFLALSAERGSPPKVIRIDRCTFKTADVEALLRQNAVRIAEFVRSDKPILVLTRRPA